MRDVMEVVEDWVGEGDPVALATVVDTKKSAPQPPGTKMAINDAGKMVGAVSGGCVEGQVVQVAEGILAGGDPQLLHYGIADEDAWDVGLPCGGEISIWVETYEDAGLQGRFSGARPPGRARGAGHRPRGSGKRGREAPGARGRDESGNSGDPGARRGRDEKGGVGDVVRAQRAVRGRRKPSCSSTPLRRRPA